MFFGWLDKHDSHPLGFFPGRTPSPGSRWPPLNSCPLERTIPQIRGAGLQQLRQIRDVDRDATGFTKLQKAATGGSPFQALYIFVRVQSSTCADNDARASRHHSLQQIWEDQRQRAGRARRVCSRPRFAVRHLSNWSGYHLAKPNCRTTNWIYRRRIPQARRVKPSKQEPTIALRTHCVAPTAICYYLLFCSILEMCTRSRPQINTCIIT